MPSCESNIETFNHIWSCTDHAHVLNEVIIASQQVLLECINNKLADNQSRVLLDDISDLWILPQDHSDLTFIDFVKGFVPLSLSQFLSSL
jgi:hypothetical protein